MTPPERFPRRPNGRRAAPPAGPRVAPLSIEQSVEGLLVRRVRVSPADVVFVKGVLEASEGLAAMFADEGGELSIAAPHARGADLAEVLADLARDVGAIVLDGDGVTATLRARDERPEPEAVRFDG